MNEKLSQLKKMAAERSADVSSAHDSVEIDRANTLRVGKSLFIMEKSMHKNAMAKYFDRVGIIRAAIREIEKNVLSLENEYHNTVNSYEIIKFCTSNTVHIIKEKTEVLIKKTTESLKLMKKENSVLEQELDSSDYRVRCNLVSSLCNSLQNALKNWQEIQQEMHAQIQNKVKNDIALLMPNSSENQICSYMLSLASEDVSQFPGSESTCDSSASHVMDDADSNKIQLANNTESHDPNIHNFLQSQEELEANVQNTYNDIIRLSKYVCELEQSMLEFDLLVREWQNAIGKVEITLENTKQSTDGALKDMRLAAEYHKSASLQSMLISTFLIMALLVIFFPLIVRYISIQYE